MFRISVILLFLGAMGTTALTQSSADPERKAGITVMRFLNTAEAAARSQSGKYVDLAELINHRVMDGVRGEITTDGSSVFYQGRQLRLLLSPDGLHYHAMVVPVESCGTAIFSDERGMIYTGKVLDC